MSTITLSQNTFAASPNSTQPGPDSTFPVLNVKVIPTVSLPTVAPENPRIMGIEGEIKIVAPLGPRVTLSWSFNTAVLDEAVIDPLPESDRHALEHCVGSWVLTNLPTLGIENADPIDGSRTSLALKPIAPPPTTSHVTAQLLPSAEPTASLVALQLGFFWAYPKPKAQAPPQAEKRKAGDVRDGDDPPVEDNPGKDVNSKALDRGGDPKHQSAPPNLKIITLYQIAELMPTVIRRSMIHRFPYVFDGSFLDYREHLALPRSLLTAMSTFASVASVHRPTFLAHCGRLVTQLETSRRKSIESRITTVASLQVKKSAKRPKVNSQSGSQEDSQTSPDQVEKNEASERASTAIDQFSKVDATVTGRQKLDRLVSEHIAAMGAAKWHKRRNRGRMAASRVAVDSPDVDYSQEPAAGAFPEGHPPRGYYTFPDPCSMGSSSSHHSHVVVASPFYSHHLLPGWDDDDDDEGLTGDEDDSSPGLDYGGYGEDGDDYGLSDEYEDIDGDGYCDDSRAYEAETPPLSPDCGSRATGDDVQRWGASYPGSQQVSSYINGLHSSYARSLPSYHQHAHHQDQDDGSDDESINDDTDVEFEEASHAPDSPMLVDCRLSSAAVSRRGIWIHAEVTMVDGASTASSFESLPAAGSPMAMDTPAASPMVVDVPIPASEADGEEIIVEDDFESTSEANDLDLESGGASPHHEPSMLWAENNWRCPTVSPPVLLLRGSQQAQSPDRWDRSQDSEVYSEDRAPAGRGSGTLEDEDLSQLGALSLNEHAYTPYRRSHHFASYRLPLDVIDESDEEVDEPGDRPDDDGLADEGWEAGGRDEAPLPSSDIHNFISETHHDANWAGYIDRGHGEDLSLPSYRDEALPPHPSYGYSSPASFPIPPSSGQPGSDLGLGVNPHLDEGIDLADVHAEDGISDGEEEDGMSDGNEDEGILDGNKDDGIADGNEDEDEDIPDGNEDDDIPYGKEELELEAWFNPGPVGEELEPNDLIDVFNGAESEPPMHTFMEADRQSLLSPSHKPSPSHNPSPSHSSSPLLDPSPSQYTTPIQQPTPIPLSALLEQHGHHIDYGDWSPGARQAGPRYEGYKWTSNLDDFDGLEEDGHHHPSDIDPHRYPEVKQGQWRNNHQARPDDHHPSSHDEAFGGDDSDLD